MIGSESTAHPRERIMCSIACFRPPRALRPSQVAGRGRVKLPPATQAEYRQVLFKPYRIIYEIDGTDIVVHMIADGRRNLKSLLLRRLTTG